MKKWIFITSLKRFRMRDYLEVYDEIDFFQKNKIEVGDIVYLYLTKPVMRVEYKMVVTKKDIPLSEESDDHEYSALEKPIQWNPSDKFVRLKLVKRVVDKRLELDYLKENGLKGTMQSNKIVNEELFEYIENFFK